MDYSIPPVAPRVRPGVVTAGVALVGVVAACELLSAMAGFAVVSDFRRVYEEAFADVDGGDVTVTTMMIGTYAGLGLNLLIGAVLGVLALFNAKGKQPARIITWVMGGLYLCCSAGGMALGAAGTAMTTGTSTDVSTADIERWTNEFIPSWYTPATTALTVISLIAMLAAVILLALPAANEFFRKPIQQWEPPVNFGQPI